MDKLDRDKSKDLTEKEIMEEPEIFLKSQVSYFGELYKDMQFRKKVFMQKEKQ